MNKMWNKALFAVAIAATACVGFAKPEKPCAEGAMPPPCMEKAMHHRHAQMGPKFDKETMELVKAYRQDPTEANLEALKAKVAANYDAKLAKKQAKLEEMKANRDQNIEKMLKRMTDPACGKKMHKGPKGPRPEMEGDAPKGPRGPQCGKKMHKGPKGPRPEMKGDAPKGPRGPRGPRPEMPAQAPEAEMAPVAAE